MVSGPAGTGGTGKNLQRLAAPRRPVQRMAGGNARRHRQAYFGALIQIVIIDRKPIDRRIVMGWNVVLGNDVLG